MEEPFNFTPATAVALILFNAFVLVLGGVIGRFLRRWHVDAALLLMAVLGLLLTIWQAPVMTGLLREGWTNPEWFFLAGKWAISAIVGLLIGGAIGWRLAGRLNLSI